MFGTSFLWLAHYRYGFRQIWEKEAEFSVNLQKNTFSIKNCLLSGSFITDIKIDLYRLLLGQIRTARIDIIDPKIFVVLGHQQFEVVIDDPDIVREFLGMNPE